MSAKSTLAIALALLLAPTAQAAADPAADGRCLGAMEAAVGMLSNYSDAGSPEVVALIAELRAANSALQLARLNDPKFDAAMIKKMFDTAAWEKSQFEAGLRMVRSAEERSSLEQALMSEAQACAAAVPAG